MSHIANSGATIPRSIPGLQATSTGSAVPSHPVGAHSLDQAITPNVPNIIFGCLAVILATAAIIIGWLQLRSFRSRGDEESTYVDRQSYELIETLYVLARPFRAETWLKISIAVTPTIVHIAYQAPLKKAELSPP